MCSFPRGGTADTLTFVCDECTRLSAPCPMCANPGSGRRCVERRDRRIENAASIVYGCICAPTYLRFPRPGSPASMSPWAVQTAIPKASRRLRSSSSSSSPRSISGWCYEFATAASPAAAENVLIFGRGRCRQDPLGNRARPGGLRDRPLYAVHQRHGPARRIGERGYEPVTNSQRSGRITFKAPSISLFWARLLDVKLMGFLRPYGWRPDSWAL